MDLRRRPVLAQELTPRPACRFPKFPENLELRPSSTRPTHESRRHRACGTPRTGLHRHCRLHGVSGLAGVSHKLYLLPGNVHAFDLNWGGFATQIARAKIRAFLEHYDR